MLSVTALYGVRGALACRGGNVYHALAGFAKWRAMMQQLDTIHCEASSLTHCCGTRTEVVNGGSKNV